MNDITKLSNFHALRVSVLCEQLEIYWLQSGRKPDREPIEVMAFALESEIEDWIGSDFLKKVIVSMRSQSKTAPSVSGIMEQARFLKKDEPKPVVAERVSYEPEKAQDWRELSSHRLWMISDPKHTAPSAWYADMLAKDPTQEEARAFMDMLCEQPKHSREWVVDRWMKKNPYGVTREMLGCHARNKNEI